MGAMLWHHAAPWRPDPADALLELQARFLAETYDLPSLVREFLVSTREAVRVQEAEGDKYELLDMYRDDLAMLEEVARHPLPDEPRRRIELVRQLYRNSGEGVGNVLDVTGIPGRGDWCTAVRLTEEGMIRLVGTPWPTLSQVRQAIYKISEEMGRSECVCLPYYDNADPERPVGWYFIGHTFD